MDELKKTGRALLVVDVQVDFCEGGALAVAGGNRVAQGVADLIGGRKGDGYDLLIASQDWHAAPPNDNSGHFALEAEPDYERSWPVHCVVDSPGAALHPALNPLWFDYVVRKGTGSQSYSAFEAVGADERTPGSANAAGAGVQQHHLPGASLLTILRTEAITDLDICGIATDHCVRASVLDALGTGFRVRVLKSLTAGVAPSTSRAALDEMVRRGAKLSMIRKETNR